MHAMDRSGLCLPQALQPAHVPFSALVRKTQTWAVMLLCSNYPCCFNLAEAHRYIRLFRCCFSPLSLSLPSRGLCLYPIHGCFYPRPQAETFLSKAIGVCYLKSALHSGSKGLPTLPWIASWIPQNYSCSPATVVVLVLFFAGDTRRRQPSHSQTRFPTMVLRPSTLSTHWPPAGFLTCSST